MNIIAHTRSLRQKGFSLIEILVIIGIMAVLMVMSAPALTAAFKGTKLSQAATDVANYMEIARQTALKENKMVELRFYEYEDLDSVFKTEEYQGLGIYVLEPKESADGAKTTGTQDMEPTISAPVKRITPGAYVVKESKMSSLLGPEVGGGAQRNLRGLVSFEKIKANYKAIVFRPDGSVNLPVTRKWFITLISNEDKRKGKENTPGDYVTLTLSPTNGEVRTYTP